MHHIACMPLWKPGTAGLGGARGWTHTHTHTHTSAAVPLRELHGCRIISHCDVQCTPSECRISRFDEQRCVNQHITHIHACVPTSSVQYLCGGCVCVSPGPGWQRGLSERAAVSFSDPLGIEQMSLPSEHPYQTCSPREGRGGVCVTAERVCVYVCVTPERVCVCPCKGSTCVYVFVCMSVCVCVCV